MRARNKKVKPLKKFFNNLLHVFNAIVIAGLLLSSFSVYVSPERFIFFSYLGLFFPFILVGNIAVFITWLIFRKWRHAALNILVFAICGMSIYTYCPFHIEKNEIPDDAIKILTYNVMRFNNYKKNDPGNPPNKILQYIIENNADIVCIQEFGPANHSSNFLTIETIKNSLKKYPYHYFHSMHYPLSSEVYDLAIFSMFPIISVKKVPYESAYNGSFITELDIKGKTVTLINNHLESNRLTEGERNNYFQMTKEIDTQSFDAFTQLLSSRLAPAFKERARQAQIISDEINNNKNKYLIVCGDFNDTPISYVRHKIKGNLRDAFVDSGSGPGTTYNKYRFLFRIDYIMHSNNIKSYKCTVGKLKSSDHYPLWCFLEFK